MCDGQAADDCEIFTSAEVESNLNDRLAKLNDQFAVINDILKAKKEDFIKMYRSNPMTSYDDAVDRLQRTLESFNPMNPMEVPELEAVETRVRNHDRNRVGFSRQKICRARFCLHNFSAESTIFGAFFEVK